MTNTGNDGRKEKIATEVERLQTDVDELRQLVTTL